MANPPELWAFLIANTGLFLTSSLLAGLSFIAYRQSDNRSSFLVATVGFVLVVLGGLVEPLYQLVVKGDFHLAGAELLWLQASEGLLIAVGLGLLYYAIVNHAPDSTGIDGGSVRMTEDDTLPYD